MLNSTTSQPVLELVPNLPGMTFAFATGECGAESWGGISGTGIIDTLATFAAAKVPYIISTGGANGAFTCGTDQGFFDFIDRYTTSSLVGIDFDLENGDSPLFDSLVARVKAAQANPKYSSLRFSFTVATLGGNGGKNNLVTGAKVMTSIQNAGLTNYYINLMTMDYGGASAGVCTLSGSSCDMGASAVQAAESLHSAWGVPYNQIEVTPMIGGNDGGVEVFTLKDGATVTAYVKEKGLAGLHWWSFDRDTYCPAGPASAKCNSDDEKDAGTLAFMKAFTS